jgi:hypothetical protein
MARFVLVIKMLLFLAAALTEGSCSRYTPPSNTSSPEVEYQIEEIVFDRSGSWGIRYGYHVVFRKNDTAFYRGDVRATPPGEHVADITIEQFEHLVRVIKDSGFFSLPEETGHGCVDTEVTTTTIVFVGGSKSVRNHGCAGANPELNRLERAIISLVEQTSWRRVAS